MEREKAVETERKTYSTPSYELFCFETNGLAQMSGEQSEYEFPKEEDLY